MKAEVGGERMEGLLKRARKIREEVKVPDDDQQDIIRQIDQVVAQNKIKLTPELFTVKARSRGLLLPLLVNTITAVLLAIGIVALAFIFSQREKQQETAVVRLSSAEGTVIAELKKEADAKMAAKEKEISDINKQLGNIAQQRDSLATTMETRINEREATLRKQLAEELDTERARLRAQGYSEDEINRRMKEFERAKNSEFTAQLAKFKKQTDAERQKLEESLQEQETQFSNHLTRANRDREKLASDAQQREAELRAQLDAQASQAANQANKNQGQLDQAAAEIKRLSQQRDQEKQAAAQIAGFYSTIKEELRLAQWDKAKETVLLLKAFLNSDQIIALEGLKQRRETESFVADSLLDLIAKEQNPGSAGTVPAGDVQAAKAAQESAEKAKVELEKSLKDAQDKFQAQLAAVQKDAETAQKRLQDQLGTQTKTTNELQKSLAAAQASLASAQTSLQESEKKAKVAEDSLKLASNSQTADLLDKIQKMNAQIADLNARNGDLDQLKKTLSSTQAERDAARKESDSRNAQLEALKSETARIKVLADSYNAMAKSWSDYLKADAARDTKAVDAPLKAKVLLDAFLSGADVVKIFPGIFDRMHAFDQANFAAGSASALPALGDKLYDIASYSSRADRLDLIKKEINSARSPQAKEFYQNLYDLVVLQQ